MPSFWLVVLTIACLTALPSQCYAQYNCPVKIELQGKALLEGLIRDTERPPTDVLWEINLQTLSFSPAKDAKGLPDPKTKGEAKLAGDLSVVIDGAGQVRLKELRLVRNKFNSSAWVIAPEDFKRILQLRKGSDKK
jgi:hypothetical protein